MRQKPLRSLPEVGFGGPLVGDSLDVRPAVDGDDGGEGAVPVDEWIGQIGTALEFCRKSIALVEGSGLQCVHRLKKRNLQPM